MPMQQAAPATQQAAANTAGEAVNVSTVAHTRIIFCFINPPIEEWLDTNQLFMRREVARYRSD
jgi:hypothetical protein